MEKAKSLHQQVKVLRLGSEPPHEPELGPPPQFLYGQVVLFCCKWVSVLLAAVLGPTTASVVGASPNLLSLQRYITSQNKSAVVGAQPQTEGRLSHEGGGGVGFSKYLFVCRFVYR